MYTVNANQRQLCSFSLQPQMDDNIQLGPGGRAFGGWGRGAGGGRNVSQEAERPQSSSNRFMALDRPDGGYDQKRAMGGRGSMGPPPGIPARRSDSREHRLTPGGGRPPMTSRPSKEREREAAISAARCVQPNLVGAGVVHGVVESIWSLSLCNFG